MGLINHDKQEEKKKNPLENEKQVKAENLQSRDLIDELEKKKRERERSTEPSYKEVTIPRNLRADNHIANKVQALINIGFADDAKGVLEALVTDKIESLPVGDQERIANMTKMLEIKDYFSQQSKGV